MNDLTGVKVGDKLCIVSRFREKCITPSGRVITKLGEFNPNGRMRGATGFDSTWACPATEDDIAGVHRYRLVQKLTGFRLWEKLSAEDLKAASEIIAKYALGNSR